jgi:hypothetical protein
MWSQVILENRIPHLGVAAPPPSPVTFRALISTTAVSPVWPETFSSATDGVVEDEPERNDETEMAAAGSGRLRHLRRIWLVPSDRGDYLEPGGNRRLSMQFSTGVPIVSH